MNKENIIIRGSDYRARKIKELLIKQKITNVVGYADSKQDIQEQENINVFSVDQLIEMYGNKQIDTIIIPAKYRRSTIVEMLKVLEDNGVSVSRVEIMQEDCKRENAASFLRKSYLEYLEYHVCDHCNMNCAGCSHFAPLVKKPKYIEFSKFRKSFQHLSTIIEDIDTIRILGGEPLLHKELDKFIMLTRRLYPNTVIRVTTNGLLVDKMDEKLIDCLKNNCVILEITLYQPMLKNAHKMQEFLREKNVQFEVLLHGVVEFDRCLCKQEEFSKEEMKKKCKTNCVEFYEGKIYPCPIAAFLNYYNSFYCERIPEESGFDIQQDSNYEHLIEYIHTSMECCMSCSYPLQGRKQFEWKQFDGNSNEWIWIRK